MSWEGEGTYRHYKGGLYEASGLGEHESTGQLFVVYVSYSPQHTAERTERGIQWIVRPLTREDCAPVAARDAFNEPATGAQGHPVERFVRWPVKQTGAEA